MAKNTFINGRFTTPRRTGAPRIIFPFGDQGDTVSQIIEQDYVILSDYYASNGIAPLDSPLPGRPGFFLVHPGTPRPAELGMTTFTRTYAKVPVPRNEWEGFIFTPPAERVAALSRHVIRVPKTVRFTGDHYETPTAAGWEPPLDCELSEPVYSNPYTTTIVDGKEVRVDAPKWTEWTYTRPYNWGLKQFIDADQWGQYVGRPYPVASRVYVRYWHNEIPPGQPTQLEVNQLGEYIYTGEICIEPTTIRRWMGNIYEARTRWAKVI